MKRSLLGLAAAASALAVSAVFYNATKPEADFWEKNRFEPLTTSAGLARRGELLQRFANNNATGYATPQDKCSAHSLALHEEKLTKDKEELDLEGSFFITSYIMLKCHTGEKPRL